MNNVGYINRFVFFVVCYNRMLLASISKVNRSLLTSVMLTGGGFSVVFLIVSVFAMASA